MTANTLRDPKNALADALGTKGVIPINWGDPLHKGLRIKCCYPSKLLMDPMQKMFWSWQMQSIGWNC